MASPFTRHQTSSSQLLNQSRRDAGVPGSTAFVSLGFVSVFSDTDAPKAMAAVHMSRRTQRKNEEWNSGFF
ncbi:hypothetical protein ACFIOY_30415 [Bradyrhizobium sp. TZ2]